MEQVGSLRHTGVSAGSTGASDEQRFARIFMTTNQLGFIPEEPSTIVTFDTTDDFHLYRVQKTGKNIVLSIDGVDKLALRYNQLALNPDGSFLDLFQTSNPTLSNSDVRRYEFQRLPVVPEPMTGSIVLLAMGSLAHWRRR